jgi:tRNA A37 N6-isopentenylltransferase MiaA
METRRYAKRQLTWFRADKEIVWLRADASGAETLLAPAVASVRDFLASPAR